MSSPLEKLIDSHVVCLCCGAKRGECRCWEEGTPPCHCERDYGCAKHCANCKEDR